MIRWCRINRRLIGRQITGKDTQTQQDTNHEAYLIRCRTLGKSVLAHDTFTHTILEVCLRDTSATTPRDQLFGVRFVREINSTKVGLPIFSAAASSRSSKTAFMTAAPPSMTNASSRRTRAIRGMKTERHVSGIIQVQLTPFTCRKVKGQYLSFRGRSVIERLCR